MRIAVEGIPTKGLDLTFSVADAWAVEACTLALDGSPSELAVTATVRRASKRGVIDVDLEATATAPAPCDRCGETVDHVVHTRGKLLYAPEEGGDASLVGEIELAADDLDVGWYAGGVLVLADVLREALALAAPTRVVCADSAECDRRTDALLAASRPDEQVGHPGFQVLKDLA